MTPAIDLLNALNINYTLHEYEHDSGASSYGLEAAVKLNIAPEKVFKTLVLDAGNKNLVVAVLPVNRQLNLKRMAKAIGAKKVTMAEPLAVSRSSGYILGGVSPLGQKRLLNTVVDELAINQSTIFVSGGRRGLEIELKVEDLLAAIKAETAAIAEP